MACLYDSEGRILELRPAPLGYGHGDVRIVLSPDELDRDVECPEFGKTLGVSRVLFDEISRQLHEGGAGARLSGEIVADQLTDERTEMRLLNLGQRVHE